MAYPAPITSRNLTQCRSCGADVVFAENESGNRQIVDAQPNEKGNLRLFTDKDDKQKLRIRRLLVDGGDPPLFIDHHATCPEEKSWRR